MFLSSFLPQLVHFFTVILPCKATTKKLYLKNTLPLKKSLSLFKNLYLLIFCCTFTITQNSVSSLAKVKNSFRAASFENCLK